MTTVDSDTNWNTILISCLLCASTLAALLCAYLFFSYPDRRAQYFPFLQEYRVKIDLYQLETFLVEDRVNSLPFWIDRKSIDSETLFPTTVAGKASESQPENIENIDPPALGPSAALAFCPPPVASPQLINTPPSYLPPPLPPRKGKPLKFMKAAIQGIPMYQAIVDLKDPQMFINIELANSAEKANSAFESHGDETFESLVKRSRAALTQNGTFFSKDDQKRVMGNMVACGKYLKYSQWENYGTTLGLKKNNEPEMITARSDGQPDWSQHWFSITCGPRLVRGGEVFVNGEEEGFTDSHVLSVGPRCAIGYPQSKDRLYIVTFLKGLSLKREAELMKALGCFEAMNLDGGASRAMAHNGQIVVPAHRPLTNVIVVYDTKFPAPQELIASWKDFQKRPDQSVAFQPY